MSLVKNGAAFAAAVSLTGSLALAQAQVRPVQPTSPATRPMPVETTPAVTKPAPVTPTPLPQPVRPQPPQPITPTLPTRPQPPKPITPTLPTNPQPITPTVPTKPQPPIQRPPNWDYRHHWNNGYYPPHWINWNRAFLFSGYYGGGYYMEVTHNIPDLRYYGFNDRPRSLYAQGRWMVCSRTYYRGYCRTFRGPQWSLGVLNGRVSSIRYVGR